MQGGSIIVQTSDQANIIVQTQPIPYVVPNQVSQQVIITSQPSRGWSSGLFNCTEDCVDCLCAFYCRPCYAIELGSLHNEHCCTIFWCGGMALTPLRTKIRAERGIGGTICNDIMVLSCCEPCALIQMKKETLQYPVATLK